MARRPHVPTDELKDKVHSFASFGIPKEHIAQMVGISLDTLNKHYEEILETAVSKANSQVAQSLFWQAVGRPAEYDKDGRLIRAEQLRVPSAGMFWMKTRARWRETDPQPKPGDVPAGETKIVIEVVGGFRKSD